MRKTILLTLSLAFLGMLPAMAQLGKVWDDFQDYARDLQSYINSETYPGINYDNVPLPERPIESELKDAIDYSASYYLEPGRLPNPRAATERFRERVYYSAGTFENNPYVQATIASNEINREITRGVADGVLGESGQGRSKVKLENVEKTIERIEEDVKEVEDSQSDIFKKFVGVLCDTLPDVSSSSSGISPQEQCRQIKQASTQLQILKVQREQAKIAGESLAYTIQGNQSLQYSNLNLANISQQIEETNHARRVDASAEAARLLRVTSQADLLIKPESEVTTQE